MNLKTNGVQHDSPSASRSRRRRGGAVAPRGGERGYTLVALLALMSILALSLTAAAPRLRQQAVRNLEREAIARGEEVAEAIALYRHAKGTPPKSMDELLEGVEPFPGAFKKIQILRKAAARDPLNDDGEWKLIRPDDRAFLDFKQSVLKYNGGIPPVTSARYKAFEPLGAISGGAIIGLDNDKDDKRDAADARCDLDTSANETATPFIGVASRSRCPSVITYYGIERHDRWVFTPVYR
ncbi:MAG: type II secretion system GspH family protein [Acidobacteria bacterium]|nr:type II secretion system GspH family protein [Acidobacteriota bacterium]